MLTGAGVSAESGILTFRDALTGLWQNFDAQTLVTADAFLDDPSLVWGWYEWRRSQVLAAQPNAAHRALAELARCVSQFLLFTQNVDNLHERAGSVDVQHLHGSLHRPCCFDCARPFVLPDGIPEEPAGGWRVTAPKCQVSVLGAGHSGIDPPLALAGRVLALAEGARYGVGRQSRKKITIVVFQKTPLEPPDVTLASIRKTLELVANKT